MNKLLITLALAVSSATTFATETAKLSVNGMVCAFCAQGIEKRLSALPATRALYVNLDQKIVAVEAKEGQSLDLAKITAEITDAGYAVVKTEKVNQTVAQIRADIKAKK
jgi:copper chaperone CopZ